MDYVECVNLSMQTSVFFLLQCFWNYLSNSVAKKTFMGSMEFKFYIVWALCSAAVFPILQWRFREDVYMRETVPQFAYSVEGKLIQLLSIIFGLQACISFDYFYPWCPLTSSFYENHQHFTQLEDRRHCHC
jgi:hypothetical protein